MFLVYLATTINLKTTHVKSSYINFVRQFLYDMIWSHKLKQIKQCNFYFDDHFLSKHAANSVQVYFIWEYGFKKVMMIPAT